MAACKEVKERKGNMFDSERYNVFISVTCSLLNVDTFYPERKEAFWSIFNGKDVFFSAHTAYGKSYRAYSFSISAAAIIEGQEKKILQNIEDGAYSLVYASPESFVGKNRWRNSASSETFREDCVAVVADVAHCLVHWYKGKSYRIYI